MLRGIRWGISKQWEVLPHRVKTAPHPPQFLLLAGRASSCTYEVGFGKEVPHRAKEQLAGLGLVSISNPGQGWIECRIINYGSSSPGNIRQLLKMFPKELLQQALNSF